MQVDWNEGDVERNQSPVGPPRAVAAVAGAGVGGGSAAIGAEGRERAPTSGTLARREPRPDGAGGRLLAGGSVSRVRVSRPRSTAAPAPSAANPAIASRCAPRCPVPPVPSRPLDSGLDGLPGARSPPWITPLPTSPAAAAASLGHAPSPQLQQWISFEPSCPYCAIDR
ncbi:Wilms tumor protein 1-interacting protein-like [Strigops habroptila]|uniref:Wilms tumor protein 1-interacting protein-like n=1 Tax=Strigops habroptila TaxID=2489341 RepID=UPI0011CFF326|nr:Wilms tumor protein 1-interacting protein-like [Strigops habroptila]